MSHKQFFPPVMSDTRKDAPEFIYLQDGAHDGEIDGPSEYDSGEVTWSSTRIYGDDTKYIRHDKYATLTAELARVRAEQDAAPEKESERWAERFNFLHTEYGSDCSGTDSGDLLDLVEAEVRQALQKVEAERNAALKNQARWLHWRKCWRHLGKMEPATAAGIDLTRVYIDSPEKLDERTDVAIAAREG